MENKSRKLLLFIFILVFIIVGIATTVKVYNKHLDRLYTVIEKRIEEQAKNCFLENICTGDETTIGFLTQKGYLKNEVDPVSKEYFNETIVVKCSNYECNVKLR